MCFSWMPSNKQTKTKKSLWVGMLTHLDILSSFSRFRATSQIDCFGFMVFNNISVISWQSVLLEKTTDLSQVTDKLYCKMLYTSPWSRFELTTSAVIGTDCIDSCKSNYHMIMATMASIVKIEALLLCIPLCVLEKQQIPIL
jgi:hypothetical protein